MQDTVKKLNRIISQRRFSPYPSFRIVYEWEDILSQALGVPVRSPGEISNVLHRRFEKNGLTGLYHALTPQCSLGLRYIMTATTEEECWYNRNSIPVIIDFWLEEKDLPAFYKAFRHVPLILVTSREVYELLLSHGCPIPVEHWGLSVPDSYLDRLARQQEKKYDFCFFGRPNPFFLRLIDEYAAKHPGFEYVLNKGSIDNRSYVTNTGRHICADTGRESYLQMIAATRISCYTTPGIDESKAESRRFNQVTPRVFEMLSNRCHVIGHYPMNPDTQWYDLSSIVPNVDDYQAFEREMDRLLKEPFDVDKASAFLKKHCTSQRAVELQEVLSKQSIAISRK